MCLESNAGYDSKVNPGSSASFSGITAPVGRCWLGTWPMQRTCPESTLTTTAPMMASHGSPWSLARCPMPPCSHSPAPTLGLAPNGTVTPASIGPTDDIPRLAAGPGYNQGVGIRTAISPARSSHENLYLVTGAHIDRDDVGPDTVAAVTPPQQRSGQPHASRPIERTSGRVGSLSA